ncbi:inositol 1,4,5-trisphosphate receptor-interacting protein-like 2 [Microcaecilia unicolor]|uniref:Inositol 1,4,5-trisphosphate receptor-interacting protein-like 2 n=1 Tax=Microcaecilia unicolor TaxID=1415580 RepID=A0A6P7YXU3_9AMPH|nr:inositol 1,4,5-trisphosphate receptor-interacting protein-like 2 [Microcaecilia unicolor]
MSGYSLNVRVFWPLLTCLCTALWCLYHALRRERAGVGGEREPDLDSGTARLCQLSLFFLLCYFLVKQCCSGGGRLAPPTATSAPGACGPEARAEQERERGARRAALLRAYYAQRVRLSPHVLGHSKAHVSKIVGELVQTGKAEARGGCGSLAFRGDFVQIGSAYEQHKVGSPDCFDILVPLKLPPSLKPEPVFAGAPLRGGGALCGLQIARGSECAKDFRSFGDSFGVDVQGRRRLSSALVLKWFHWKVQRCLAVIKYQFQERCHIALVVCNDRLVLKILPRSDYVCCHISMAVRLIPAVHVGDATFLIAQPWAETELLVPGLKLEAMWGINCSKQEQRLLGWFKEQTPARSCHLKCLQMVKALRDLNCKTFAPRFSAQWRAVLSSYTLKTALFYLLLRGPWEAWEESCLAERLEDFFLFFRECLHKQTLMHFFLGNSGVPDVVTMPKALKDAPAVNLLAGFEARTLDLVSFQLLNTWNQIPQLLTVNGNPRYLVKSPTSCKSTSFC